MKKLREPNGANRKQRRGQATPWYWKKDTDLWEKSRVYTHEQFASMRTLQDERERHNLEREWVMYETFNSKIKEPWKFIDIGGMS